MGEIILRDYQQKAVEKAVWALQLEGNDLLCLATGAGKSIVIAEIVSRVDKPVLILQPSREILEQNLSKLQMYVSRYDIGVFSASMNQKVVRKFTFATIQSIYKRPYLFDHVGLVIIDEAHLHNIKNTDSMYMSFLKAIGNKKVIGLTATPYRNVTGYHKDSRGELFASVTLKLINRMNTGKKDPPFWKRILVNVGIGDLIEQGHLSRVEYENHTFIKHEDMKLNKSMSDFDLDDYAVKLGSRQQQVVECILDAQKRFKSLLVFCPSVGQAEMYARVIPNSAAVSAKTSDYERERIGRDFKAGRIQTIFNMGVYTTGFDYPELECVVLLRPTRSLGLYMQMLGRVVRKAEGKRCGTVIDWTNTVEKLGRIETVELRREQFPEFKSPMWDIFSEKGRWHNTPLYSYAIKKTSQNSRKNWAIAKNRGWR